jgi:hypothetical protein
VLIALAQDEWFLMLTSLIFLLMFLHVKLSKL